MKGKDKYDVTGIGLLKYYWMDQDANRSFLKQCSVHPNINPIMYELAMSKLGYLFTKLRIEKPLALIGSAPDNWTLNDL